jgi:hypothetical protein
MHGLEAGTSTHSLTAAGQSDDIYAIKTPAAGMALSLLPEAKLAAHHHGRHWQ